MLGYLRETEEIAKKEKIDPITGVIRTGLDTYLKVIFPEITDWIHDKSITGITKKRPDYRSESLKMIIEFDGIPHYTSPIQIKRDEENTKYYESLGYKVIRIPYFIQLTHDVVLKLFNKNISSNLLFDESIPSLYYPNIGCPGFLCPLGIKRMAKDFMNLSQKQYEVNVEKLIEANNNDITGVVNLISEVYHLFY